MLVSELFEADQARVDIGAVAQAAFARNFKKKFPGSRVVSISKRSSQVADIVVRYQGERLQFEIKARTGPDETNVVYAKTMRRGDSNKVFDAFARSFNDNTDSFCDLIDLYRKEDTSVGFPEDEGVKNSSGKIPWEFKSDDPDFLSLLRSLVIKHLKAHGDNYFGLYDLSTGTTSIYFTGHGENILSAKPYPKLTFVQIDTYGGGYKNSMRVAAKANIAASSKTVTF